MRIISAAPRALQKRGALAVAAAIAVAVAGHRDAVAASTRRSVRVRRAIASATADSPAAPPGSLIFSCASRADRLELPADLRRRAVPGVEADERGGRGDLGEHGARARAARELLRARFPRAGGRVRAHLLRLRRAGDHGGDAGNGGQAADRDLEQ